MADIKKNILLLPGDGIGPEIIDQAKKVLDEVKSNNLFDFSLETGYIGGAAYDKYKDPFPCLLYTSPSPRDVEESRMPSSA